MSDRDEGIPRSMVSQGEHIDVDHDPRAMERLASRLSAVQLEMLVELFELSPILFAATDFDGVFRALNPAWEAVLGVPPRELVGRNWRELVHPDDLERTEQRGASAKSSGGVVDGYMFRLRAADGSYRTLRWWSNISPEQRIGVSIVFDATAHVRAQEERRIVAQRNRAVVEGVVDGILTTDASMVVETANPAARTMFGAGDGALGGVPLTTLVPGLSDHFDGRGGGCGVSCPPIVKRAFEAVRIDGSTFPISVSLTPIALEDGTTFCTMVARDLTRLTEVERVKEEFVSVVSHELRTPMTAVKGALKLVLAGAAGDIPPKATQLLALADSSVDRLVRLVNDILDVSRIEAGTLGLHRRHVAVHELVTREVELVREPVRERDIDIELVHSCTGDGCGHDLDPDRIAQVITNLLANAIAHAPDGSTVTVEVTCDEAVLRVEVLDRGTGIPESFRDRIFQRFAQADSADTRPHGGSGLGLNISRSIVELHGGEIGFHDREGGGTAFWFTVPRTSQDAGDQA